MTKTSSYTELKAARTKSFVLYGTAKPHKFEHSQDKTR